MPVSGHRRAMACLWCLAAYLFGSVPFVGLLGRRWGVDLRRRGSGNVGAANLWAATGAATGVAGWLLDAAKGVLPVIIGRRLQLGEEARGAAGVCGLAGQCWPLFSGRQGGRGISAFVGAALAIDPASGALALLPLIGGSLWRVAPLLRRNARLGGTLRATRSASVPLGCLVGVLAFPLLRAARVGRPSLPAWALACLIVTRRLSAPLPDDACHGPRRRRSALLYRLLYDRNLAR